MSKSETKQPKEKNKILKRIIDITLAVIIAGGAIYGINKIANDSSDIDSSKQKNNEAFVDSNDSKLPSTNSASYVSAMVDNEEIYSGALIIVNEKTEYKGKEDTLVSMYDILQNDGTDAYQVESADVKIRMNAATALNNMIKAFAEETGKKDIVVGGGYRSIDFQKEQYEADPEKAAAPGHSDYHTGYSVDFSISDGEDGFIDFEGQDEYKWFEENGYKYGFIVRFPKDKKDSTGYDYRPWHFRYVGAAHAYYIHKNNLSLEEYVDLLKGYEYNSDHLKLSDDNGNEYEAYYYPADMANTQTSIAVPNTDYQKSGNNTDGFIIISQTKSENSASEETTENTSENKTTDKADEKSSENSDDSKAESTAE